MSIYLDMFYSLCNIILESDIIIDTHENDIIFRYRNYGISLKFWNR